jgi:hypothetical protein
MLETDGYFRLAAENYRRAGDNLKEAETHLRRLLERLESRSEAVPAVSETEDNIWSRVDDIINSNRPVRVKEPTTIVS